MSCSAFIWLSGDSDADRVGVGVKFGVHAKAGAGGGRGDGLRDDFVAGQGPATPSSWRCARTAGARFWVLLGFLWLAKPGYNVAVHWRCAKGFVVGVGDSRCLRDRPSKLKGAAHRARDGLRPPLTSEPLRPLMQQASAGQACRV